MLLFSQDVFDDFISGSSSTWRTPAIYDGLLGSADELVIIAHATNVLAGTTDIKVWFERSADGQNWIIPLVTPLFTLTSPSTVPLGKASTNDILSFVRLRVSMTGSTPGCRLKLTATGRSA